MEAQRVLGVVAAPARVPDALHHLEPDRIARLVASVDEKARHALRLGRADVGGLEDRAEDSLGGDRVAPDELAVADDPATEVLRPGAILCGVEDHPSDLLRTELGGLLGECQERVGLAISEELLRVDALAGGPGDLLLRVDA